MLYTYKIYIIRFVSFVAFLLCAITVINAYASTEKEKVAVNVTLQFELVDGLILVQASRDGRPGSYILDTGAPHLMINQKVDRVDFQLWTVNGNMNSSEVDISTFEYGSILREDVEAWAMDLTYIEDLIGRPIAGILGNNLLKDYSIVINYEHREISFIADRVSFTTSVHDYDVTSVNISDYEDHLPIVELQVDGQLKKLAFDTGAAISVLDATSISDAASTTTFRSIGINNIKISKAPFCFKNLSELKNLQDHAVDGILSVTSLNASKVLIDYKTERIYMFWSKEQSL